MRLPHLVRYSGRPRRTAGRDRGGYFLLSTSDLDRLPASPRARFRRLSLHLLGRLAPYLRPGLLRLFALLFYRRRGPVGVVSLCSGTGQDVLRAGVREERRPGSPVEAPRPAGVREERLPALLDGRWPCSWFSLPACYAGAASPGFWELSSHPARRVVVSRPPTQGRAGRGPSPGRTSEG